jgi:serine/threonine protein kinase
MVPNTRSLILLLSRLQRLKKTLDSWSAFYHENIVKLLGVCAAFDLCPDLSFPALVMQFCGNGNISEVGLHIPYNMLTITEKKKFPSILLIKLVTMYCSSLYACNSVRICSTVIPTIRPG